MIKTRFGDPLRSKTETASKNETLAKVLCHNICCVTSAIYDLGCGRNSGYSRGVRLKAVYRCVLFAGFVLALLNVVVLFLKSRLSTTSPTAMNTLAYADHGKTYYMPPAIADGMIGLMIAYFVVFGGGVILASVLKVREGRNACPKNQASAQ